MEETCWKTDKAGYRHVDILLSGQTQMWLVAEVNCERNGWVGRVFLVEKPWLLLPKQCPECGSINYGWNDYPRVDPTVDRALDKPVRF